MTAIFPDLPFVVGLSHAQLAGLMLVLPPGILIYLSAKWYLSLKNIASPKCNTLRSLKIIPIIFSLGLALLFWLFLKDSFDLRAQGIYLIAIVYALILGMRVTKQFKFNYLTQLISCFYIFLSIAVIHTLASLFILTALRIAIYGFELKSIVGSILGSVPTIITIFMRILFTGSILAPIFSLFRFQKKRYAEDSLVDDSYFE